MNWKFLSKNNRVENNSSKLLNDKEQNHKDNLHIGRVSIIIPVFNQEKFIAEAIESSLNQTYSDIEVIVVDDGSTDQSPEIIKSYSDRITIITQKNRGISSAYNVGIKKMSGEWFKWMSGDDILYPNAVEELIKTAKDLGNYKKWIPVSNWHTINENGKLLEEGISPDLNKKTDFEFKVILLDHMLGNPNTSLIHRSLLDQYGMLNENRSIVPDYELWLTYCVLHDARLWFFPKFLLKYRKHDKSYTETVLKKRPTPEYNQANAIALIFRKLSPEKRQKYELALDIYREPKEKIKKLKEKIKKNIEDTQEHRKKIIKNNEDNQEHRKKIIKNREDREEHKKEIMKLRVLLDKNRNTTNPINSQ